MIIGDDLGHCLTHMNGISMVTSSKTNWDMHPSSDREIISPLPVGTALPCLGEMLGIPRHLRSNGAII